MTAATLAVAATASATYVAVAPADATTTVLAGSALNNLEASAFVAAAGESRALLADRAAQGDRAARTTTRGALAGTQAVTAPRSLAASGGVTAYTVKAVAKPKPKPKPVVPVASGAAAGSGAAAASSGGTSAYAGAGAALGLTPAAAAVYSAVRSTFGITNIGGRRPGDWGDHGTGRAVDVMISSSGQGDAVAAYIIANMGRLGVSYVIWRQRIWMSGTGGWRCMGERGSATANHDDHVHISGR